jgi:hypothetical protein
MSRIRRIRFSVAALLLGVIPIAGAALVFARWTWRIRAEKAAREVIEGAGGVVDLAPAGPKGEGADSPSQWFLALVGERDWRPVWGVYFRAGSGVTNEHIQAVAAFRDLRHLTVGRCSIDDWAFDCLRGFSRLESLKIHSKKLKGDCLHQIVSPSLEWLDLRDSPIEDAALLQLNTSLPIETLELSNTRITDVGLAHVLKLTNLRLLAVERTAIKGHGFKNAITRHLGNVNLSSTALDDTTVAYLCELPSLGVCALNGTAVTNNGLLKLAQMPNLSLVEVRDTRVTSEGTLSLFELRPDVMVFWDHFKASGWQRPSTDTRGLK